jgi:NitT/TauT family transport system substrate-binding protein
MRTAAIFAAVLLSVVGCSSSGDKPTPAAADKAPQKVGYVTAFGTFGRESYAWVASQKGFFKDAGFEVDIQPGAAGETNTNMLEAGKVQFAVVDFATVLSMIGTGKHTDIQAVAAIQQRTVSSVVTLDGKGITGPKDLAGKTLGVAPGSILQTLFPGYAQLAGFDPKTVKFVNGTPQALPGMLASGQVDGLLQYLVGAPSVQAAAHKDTVVLPYSDYMADPYGAVLITTTKLLKDNPDEVKRFSNALMKGLKYAVDNPDEAGTILHTAVPTQDAKTASAELKLMKQYVMGTQAGAPVGSFDQARVARAIASLQSLNLFPAGLTPDRVIDFDLSPKV